MKKMILQLASSFFVLIAILVMPVSVFAVTDRDVSNGTDETLSALSGNAYIKIDDPCCVGYCVYVDGAYKLTEGGSGNPDGYCAFYVSAGTHTIRINKNGLSASITKYFQSGYTYRWVSMPYCWCNDPHPEPTHEPEICQVYIKVEDPCCKGYSVYVDGSYILTEGADGNPDGFCAFYVSSGTHKFELRKGDYHTSKSWYCQCGTVYRWVSMPCGWCGDCQVYIQVDDNTCAGFDVYVDGAYILTEGADGNPDGYCAFYVSKGTHKFELRKGSYPTSKSWYCNCDTVYTWVSMPDYWCGDPCEHPPTVTFDKTNYYAGDTVQATVSTSFSSVYYQIKDCSGLVIKDGDTSDGGTIYYTLPAVVTDCCNWQICLYWGSGKESKGTGSECTESYDFWVCSAPEIFEDLIFLSGPVNAKITDQYGRVIDDTGINQIPNARVVSIGDEKKFFIPSDLDYTVDIVAYDSGKFTLSQSSPRGKDLVSVIGYWVQVTPGSHYWVSPKDIGMCKDSNGDGICDDDKIPPDWNNIVPSIQLHAGWNLISLPKNPEALDVLGVMRMVGDNLNSVWTYEEGIWKRYDLTGPSFLNDLSALEPGKGYWIDMKSSDRLDDLYVTGRELTDKSISLASGWNLVGYNSLSSMSITDAMNSVAGNWNSIWTYEDGDWKRYDLSGPDFLNDPIVMEPGKGYWIDMKSHARWTLGA